MDSWTDELQFETSTPLTSINTHMKATQHPHAQRTPAWPRTLPTPLRNETLLPGSRHASAGARQSGSYTRTLRHRYAPRKGRAGPTTSPAVGSPLEAPRGPYGWDQDQALCCCSQIVAPEGWRGITWVSPAGGSSPLRGGWISHPRPLSSHWPAHWPACWI